MVIETVLNQPERSLTTSSYKIAPPKPNDSTRLDIAINTIGITGLNDFSLSVNPRIERELYYDNNLITYRNFLEVAGDQTDPFIEVLFDGRQIINGDIVSPDPSITIKIRDENPYLRLTDTTSVQLFIKRNCDECSFSRVSFSDDRVNWSAADDDQDFTVEYNPGRLDDGTYTLRITATDKSGNSAGEEPFLISFEVVNESAITNFYPYPNPFSTSTRFIFTLTGTQVPDDLMIQIMTVSGKVVREITTEEIGPVHIGNNMTQYAWDGRDEFGDKLANGVYLYKVFARINGDHIKRRNTSADKAFKNGFGKLYILR